MRKLFIILFIAFSTTVFSQIDTSGGRYWDESLFPNVTVTSNVTYGSNTKYNGQVQTLLMDIYEPQGDTVSLRPLIVFAHGGSFIGGSKTDGDLTTLCTRFAKMGYVTASIEYRYGMFPIDSVNAIKAVLRATQDMKAAVRWFRQDATGANTYKVHPGYLFTGGSSAGAFMALHQAYMDKVSEFPLGAAVLNSMGGFEGTSGNPGYNHMPLAVINLCGALGDSLYLEPGDIPLVSMHGDLDGIVPFGSAMISIVIFDIMEVDGSSSIKVRADNLGIQNPFFPWYGADHVPYAGTGAIQSAYMDTTVNFVKAFLRPFLGLPLPTAIASEEKSADDVLVYPNPSTGSFYISKANEPGKLNCTITDMTGKMVDQFYFSGLKYSYDSKLEKGIYLLQLSDEKNYQAVQKIVVQ